MGSRVPHQGRGQAFHHLFTLKFIENVDIVTQIKVTSQNITVISTNDNNIADSVIQNIYLIANSRKLSKPYAL